MRNIKITMEYDGSNYHGWQRQLDEISIQEVLETTISKLVGEDIQIIGSGRTDRGVHALGQVANFYTNSTIPATRFKKIFNDRLPGDIKILKSEEVSLEFHARFSANMKRYKYIVYNNEQPRPLYRNYSYHVAREIDLDKFKRASRCFLGKKDFKSFMATKSLVDTTVRTIHDIEIEVEKDFIIITFIGESFLRHMIRIIVGTLVYVGIGRIDIGEVEAIILGGNRPLAGKTAPAQGLFLEKVYYNE